MKKNRRDLAKDWTDSLMSDIEHSKVGFTYGSFIATLVLTAVIGIQHFFISPGTAWYVLVIPAVILGGYDLYANYPHFSKLNEGAIGTYLVALILGVMFLSTNPTDVVLLYLAFFILDLNVLEWAGVFDWLEEKLE